LSALANRIWRAKAREFADGAAAPHYFGHRERTLAATGPNLAGVLRAQRDDKLCFPLQSPCNYRVRLTAVDDQ
jgi:hypothetical protein